MPWDWPRLSSAPFSSKVRWGVGVSRRPKLSRLLMSYLLCILLPARDQTRLARLARALLCLGRKRGVMLSRSCCTRVVYRGSLAPPMLYFRLQRGTLGVSSVRCACTWYSTMVLGLFVWPLVQALTLPYLTLLYFT